MGGTFCSGQQNLILLWLLRVRQIINDHCSVMSAHIAQRQRVEPLEPEIESSKPHRDIFQLYFSYESNEI